MAAEEVIYFHPWVQLLARPKVPVPALPPPEPVAESPPQINSYYLRVCLTALLLVAMLRVCLGASTTS